MNEIYWHIKVKRIHQKWSVYNTEIPLSFMNFQGAISTSLIKIEKINFEFIETDYTRYIKVFQRKWRGWNRIRKKAFKYLRMRELGLAVGHLR